MVPRRILIYESVIFVWAVGVIRTEQGTRTFCVTESPVRKGKLCNSEGLQQWWVMKWEDFFRICSILSSN